MPNISEEMAKKLFCQCYRYGPISLWEITHSWNVTVLWSIVFNSVALSATCQIRTTIAAMRSGIIELSGFQYTVGVGAIGKLGKYVVLENSADLVVL